MLSNLEFTVKRNLGLLSKQTNVSYNYTTLQSFAKSSKIPLFENVQATPQAEYALPSVYTDIVFRSGFNPKLFKPVYFVTLQPLDSIQGFTDVSFMSNFSICFFIQGPTSTTLRFGEEMYEDHYCHLYLQFQPDVITKVQN